jgi:hypothetical protein
LGKISGSFLGHVEGMFDEAEMSGLALAARTFQEIKSELGVCYCWFMPAS